MLFPKERRKRTPQDRGDCVGFTGTQHGMTAAQKAGVRRRLIRLRTSSLFRHGDCVEADENAHDLALQLGYTVIVHPPTDDSRRAFVKGYAQMLPPRPYLHRNRDIVDASDALIAAPHTSHEVLRSGTWSTVRYARKLGLTVYLVLPDGSEEVLQD